MFDGRFRAPIERAVRPVGNGLRRTGVTPDHLTLLGLLLSFVAAFVIAKGWLVAGLLVVILAALPDLLDGAVAKAGGNASQRGAYFDSVADRVTDAVLMFGVAWYLLGTEHPYNAMVPFAIMGVSFLISYQRAKAESLGLNAKGGLMERAERIVLLCVGLAFSVLLVPILWLMLVLTTITAGQRFVKVWRQAIAAPVVIQRQEARRSRRVARRSARAHRRTQLRRRRTTP
jgi:CDP-diacylglycerol---glycerol-3-phosphate 3-phosphatidyltransferase